MECHEITSRAILIVEDEILIALMTQRELERKGYQVCLAASGDAAVAAALDPDSSIDLILMDIDLGAGMDGVETAQRILAEKDIPIVFVSSHTEPEIVEKTEAITSYGYVVKNSGVVVLDASIKMAFRLFEAQIEEQRKEHALRESEERLRLAHKATNDVVWDWDIVKDMQMWNEAGAVVFGWTDITESPQTANWWLERVHPEDRERMGEGFFRVVNSSDLDRWQDEYRFLRADGSYAQVIDRGYLVRDRDGKPVRMIGAMQDITDQRRAEETILEGKNNLTAIIEASPESVILIDVNGVLIACNQIAAYRLGVKTEEVIGKNIFDYLPSDVAEKRREYIQRIITTRQPLQSDDARGNYYFRNFLQPIFEPDGRLSRIAIYGQDISEYRRTEDQLNRRNRLLSAVRDKEPHDAFEKALHILIETTDSAYGFLDEVLFDPDGTPYKFSLAMSDISWDDDSQRLYQELLTRKLEFRNLNNLSGAPVLEKRVIITNNASADPRFRGLPHGHPAIDRYMGIPLVFSGQMIGVAGIANRSEPYTLEMAEEVAPLLQTCAVMIWSARLFREREKNLADLKASEEKYRCIAETANEGSWAMDGQYRTTYVNQRMADMLGYTIEEMVGKSVDSFMTSDQLVDHQHKMECRQLGRNDVYERQFLNKAGVPVWMQVSAMVLQNEQGHFIGSFAMLTDITERKRAEEALKALAMHQQSLLDTIPDIIMEVDSSKMYTWANPAGYEFFGKDVIGHEAAYYFEREQKTYEIVKPLFNGVENVTYLESWQRRLDGEVRLLAWWCRVLKDENGNAIGAISTARDITEQRRNEEAVEVQLREKEILLREVHHRIKNNIGTIRGLLALQLESTTNTEVKTSLLEAVGRLESMRAIYEKLLVTEDFGEIPVKAYLEGLTSALTCYFPKELQIEFVQQIDQFYLDSKRLFLLGLIVNELVSNSVKYAFTERTQGAIRLVLVKNEKKVILISNDNGQGLPLDFNLESRSGFGLRLVNMIAQQLNGTFSIMSTGNGTECMLMFYL